MFHSTHARGLRVTALLMFFSTLMVSQGQKQVEKDYADAQKALADGRYQEAAEGFEKICQIDPAIAEVHANLGLIYFRQRQLDRAIPALRQALKLKPNLTKANTLLAICLAETGQFREALFGLEACVHQYPAGEVRRMCGLQLIRTYNVLEHQDKAVEMSLQLTRMYPNDPEVLYETEKVYGNFAFLTMQKLAELAPESIWRHQAAAEAYESQGSNDLAIAEYRTVVASDPRRPGVHYRLGRTLLSRAQERDIQAAADEFTQELAIDPTNANAAYELGEICRKAGQLRQAAQYFRQALKYYPDFEQARIAVAAVLISEGTPALALDELKRALALNSKNEIAYYRLAQAYKALGKPSEQGIALAEYARLHAQNAEHRLVKPLDEVTKQELDSVASQYQPSW